MAKLRKRGAVVVSRGLRGHEGDLDSALARRGPGRRARMPLGRRDDVENSLAGAPAASLAACSGLQAQGQRARQRRGKDRQKRLWSIPPFSLFREYVTTLIEHGKGFIVVAPASGVKYRETFPLIRDGRMWLGYNSGDMAFTVPDYYEPRKTRYWQDETGQKWRSMGNMCWITNLDLRKRHEELILYRRYEPERYLSYTNFDGIDVPNVAEIPCDWAGNMGVPITFLEQHNPDQFEIVGLGEGNLAKEIGITRDRTGRTKLEVEEDGKRKNVWARIVIRNRCPEEARS